MVGVAALPIERTELQSQAVEGEPPDVHSGIRPRQAFGRQSGIFERLPTHLEQHALLRIHVLGFAGRDAEKARVEMVHALAQESAFTNVHFPGFGVIGVIEAVRIPALGRNVDDGIRTFGQELPEFSRGVRATRKTAPDSNDGNGFAATVGVPPGGRAGNRILIQPHVWPPISFRETNS